MGILHNVLEVFTEIGSWIADAIQSLLPIFYNTETGLTLIGVLAVAGLAFSVIFLVMRIIENFLHFRG